METRLPLTGDEAAAVEFWTEAIVKAPAEGIAALIQWSASLNFVEERLETARLTLVPLTLVFIRALPSRRLAEVLIGADIPDGWPDEELAGLLPLYAGWVVENPAVVGYGPWAVIHRRESLVVGSAGFIGLPKPDGSVELGFGILPDHRRRGYASEAAQALAQWSLAQPAVKRVIATCEPDNRPSTRVLEKVGMTRVSDDGAVVTWELARSRGVATQADDVPA